MFLKASVEKTTFDGLFPPERAMGTSRPNLANSLEVFSGGSTLGYNSNKIRNTI